MKKKLQTRVIIESSDKQPNTVLRCVLFAMFLTVVAFAVVTTFGNMVVPKQARAAANYSNATNVDVALRYVGMNGGNAALMLISQVLIQAIMTT